MPNDGGNRSPGLRLLDRLTEGPMMLLITVCGLVAIVALFLLTGNAALLAEWMDELMALAAAAAIGSANGRDDGESRCWGIGPGDRHFVPGEE